MFNLGFGIGTVLLCTLLSYIAYKQYLKNDYYSSLLLIIAVGFLLRIYVGTDFFLHLWDERYHALVAKNLLKHPFIPTLYDNPVLLYNYKAWFTNHIWVHKQPLPLWCMALSMKLFGINELAIRIPSIILSSIAIFFTYYIGTYLFNQKIALLAAFFHSINGYIIEITGGRAATDHFDLFFLFFIELSVFLTIVYLIHNKKYISFLIGISTGLAILCKWLPALIVIPIWIFLVIEKKSWKTVFINLLIIVVFCILTFLPWQLYIFKTFPKEAHWESAFNLKHITEVLEGHKGNFLYFFDNLRMNLNELIYLPMLWFIYKTLTTTSKLKYYAIITWFIVPSLFFSFAKTKMPGYILFTYPALFLIISFFCFDILEINIKHRYKILIKIIFTAIIALAVRFSIERIKPFEFRDRNPIWTKELRELNKQIITNDNNKVVIFNIDHPIEAMFYTNFTAYKVVPSEIIMKDLFSRGYEIYVYDKKLGIPNKYVGQAAIHKD